MCADGGRRHELLLFGRDIMEIISRKEPSGERRTCFAERGTEAGGMLACFHGFSSRPCLVLQQPQYVG